MKWILLYSIVTFPFLVYSQNNNYDISVNTSYGKLVNNIKSSRFKLSVNNLILNRIGSYLLLESSEESTYIIVGQNIQLKNRFFINMGYELGKLQKVLKGTRKEIGVSYRLKKIPLIINYSYSLSKGSSINIGYRINMKKRRKDNEYIPL